MDVMQLRRMLMNMEVSGMKLTKLGAYTVMESWETDSVGNPITIGQTVLNGHINGFGVYVLEITNNNPVNGTYKALQAYYPVSSISDIVNNVYGFCIRGSTPVTRALNTTTSFYVSQGAIINIYKVQ